jgi:hypothetical protein
VRGLLKNLPLKAASLGLAMLLWLVIAGQKSSERGLVVPVEFQNLPRGLELSGDIVNTVEVRLRASPGIIHAIGARDASAQVDLREVTAGERIVHLTPEAIRVPFGVRVMKITPSLLTLHFEPTLEKVIPVRPRVSGKPAEGYEVAELVSDPPEVRVGGGRSRVEALTTAFTEAVSVEGASANVTASVNVGLEDAGLRVEGDARVRVVARVREVSETRNFDGLLVRVRDGEAQVHPTAVRVTLSGPASVLRKLQPPDIGVFVPRPTGSTPLRATPAVELPPALKGVTVLAV